MGRAWYKVNDDYTWGLDVNLVQVLVEAPADGAFDNPPGTTEDRGMTPDPTFGPLKEIGSGNRAGPGAVPGLRWRARVTFNGPVVTNGIERGVQQMNAGFVQNVALTTLRATYAGKPQRVHQMESTTNLLDGDELESRRPYYNSKEPNSVFFNPRPGNGQNTKVITDSDTPSIAVPVRFDTALTTQNLLQSVDVQFDFGLFVVAATVDKRTQADDVYAIQSQARQGVAGAIGWRWRLTANLAAGNYAFERDGDDLVTPPTVWQAVTDGSEPTKGPVYANVGYKNLRNWFPGQ